MFITTLNELGVLLNNFCQKAKHYKLEEETSQIKTKSKSERNSEKEQREEKRKGL